MVVVKPGVLRTGPVYSGTCFACGCCILVGADEFIPGERPVDEVCCPTLGCRDMIRLLPATQAQADDYVRRSQW